MKISKNSWHYKSFKRAYEILETKDFYPPNSLCGYFWMCLAYHFFPVLIVGVITILFAALVMIPFMELGFYMFTDLDELSTETHVLLCVMLAIVGFLIFGILVSIYQDKRREKFGYDKPLGFVGVTWEVAKATKSRFCPTIDYED